MIPSICLIVITLIILLWVLSRPQKTKADTELTDRKKGIFNSCPPNPVQNSLIPEIVEPLEAIEKRSIILTGHSIDRASTRHYGVYLAYREQEEDGLYTWLMREMKSFRASGQLKDGINAIDHLGVLWAIVVKRDVIVLKSLSFKRGKHRRKKPLSKNQIEKLKRRKGNARVRDD